MIERFSGKFDDRTLQTTTAYGDSSGERLLEETGRPRILIMLHDFIETQRATNEQTWMALQVQADRLNRWTEKRISTGQ